MENIRFIKELMTYVNGEKKAIGNCIYMQIGRHNRIKAYCNSASVILRVINIYSGEVDGIELPFFNYFDKVQCAANAPMWTQHIYMDKWNYETQYPHLVPKDADYLRIGTAINAYIDLFRDKNIQEV